jgi:alpha-tubulin suppressor-like RCC1 family protein
VKFCSLSKDGTLFICGDQVSSQLFNNLWTTENMMQPQLANNMNNIGNHIILI